MRGLAFPPNADADRELSYEYGTPISNGDDIPIDPALSGATIDPALMMEGVIANVVQLQPEDQHPQNLHLEQDDYQVQQYSQGPQGDPFAPQIPAPYFPLQDEEPITLPKPKRKRKVHREGCSFCSGNAKKNKRGEAEFLVTCHECGRSGHPSCMGLERLTSVLQSYAWKCLECKNCEVCQEKGDDDRILFCDLCDRGWHMECMVPPLQEPPDGEWHCPECAPINPDMQMPEHRYFHPEEAPQSPVEVVREESVASTSRSVVEEPLMVRRKGKKRVAGKARARATPRVTETAEGSDLDEPVMDVPETPMLTPRPRGRPKKPTTKLKTTPATSDDERPASPVRPAKRRRAPPRDLTPPLAPLPRVRLRLPAQRGKGKEREEEEPHGLFDDILGVEERDTSKTTISNSDKLYFERSRLAAEEKIAPPPPPTASSSRIVEATEDISVSGRSRPLRSATLQHIQTPLPKRIDFSNSPGPSTPGGAFTPLPKFEPGVLRIRTIRFGPYDIKTWYDAPFPEEYASIPDGRLWICEFCLKYMKSRFGAIRHQMKCKARHPPGDEIYRDGTISIFEVDGRRNKIYCQNLCLLSKMFLDHKSLFYDVEPFLFYVITQVDEFGARFVGYFSKEKRCPKDYNLSCIMTLPVRQRQGWGNLLIDFSYLLSKIEQRLGSPEKPLSSLGALGYRNYWTLALMRYLHTAPDNLRLEEICAATSMTMEDVCNTLIQQSMIFIREATPPPIRPSPGQAIKYPKGRKNGIARRQLQRMQTMDKDADGNKAPFVPPKHYEIHFDREKVEGYLKHWESKGYLKLKPEKLQWTPYLVTRGPQEQTLPLMPAMDTDNSKVTTVGPFMQPPTTPAPSNGIAVKSPLSMDDDDDNDELPMVIDSPAEPRTRTRSFPRSPTKEKDVSRSSRSHRPPSPVHMSTPLVPLRSLRTRSSNANIPSPMAPPPEESTSARPSRRGATRKTSSRKVESVNNDDEAFAAKLALEEQMQGRQLRSRRSESQMENKKPAILPLLTPPKAPPTRKRPRIDSSPEMEDSPPPEPVGEDVAPKDDGDEPMDVDLMINGGPKGHLDIQTDAAAEEEKEDVVKEVLNMDVKSEDTGTPLTSLTSRQSVPSDDTVIITDHKAADKFANYQGPVHAESDLRSTLTGYFDLDDCHDEDADGEDEEDAEGEPDPDY